MTLEKTCLTLPRNQNTKQQMDTIKESKFQIIDADFDSRISQREISGKVTLRRRKALEHSVRKFNKRWEAPYGYSPNGYAYRCGCIHDCCGCLDSKSMSIEFKKLGRNHNVILTIHQNFNY